MAGDVLFTSYAFKARGGTANRTMPERLAGEKNVLEYGADPTNNVDSTTVIQQAITDALADGTGVYFPPGYYKTSGSGSALLIPGNTNFGFYMRGNGTTIEGHCPGYVVDRSLGTPNNTIGPRVFEGLNFVNSNTTGGGLRIGSTIGVTIRNCSFGVKGIGLTTEDSPGASSQNIVIDTCTFASPGGTLASVGLVMGGSGSMTACDFNGIGIAAILYGSAISMNANRCERCDTGFRLGVDSAGTVRGLNGYSCVSLETEGVVTLLDFMGNATNPVTGFSVGPIGLTGHPSGNGGLEGFNANTQYGIRIRPNAAYYGEFVFAGFSQWFDVGCIYIEDYATPKRSFITFTSCNPAVGSGSGVPWRIPAASAWPRFTESASIDSSSNAPYGTRYTYASLPSGGDVLEGDEYDISDGNSGTIGGTVTAGGGANRVRVRWNGTNWICLPG